MRARGSGSVRSRIAGCWLGAAAWALSAGASSAGEGVAGRTEERVLFDGGTAGGWGIAESTVAGSTDRQWRGRPTLRWGVVVDHETGEPKYPIGWPRFNRPLPDGPDRDWAAWDELLIRARAEFSRGALPRDPVTLIVHAPDKRSSFVRPLDELRAGEWVEIRVPLSQIAGRHDVRLIQFSVSEADYRHGDKIDLYLERASLVRFVEPTLAAFEPECRVLYSDARALAVRFDLLGGPAGAQAEVLCDLWRAQRDAGDRVAPEGRDAGERIAGVTARATRGSARAVIDLGGRKLAPGEYRVTGKVAGAAAAPVTAAVRLVESPWR